MHRVQKYNYNRIDSFYDCSDFFYMHPNNKENAILPGKYT